MPYKYSWQVSLAVLGGTLILLFAMGPETVGGVVASAIDIRYILILALGAIGLNSFGPLVVSLVVALIRAAHLRIVLPPLWEELQIPPYSFFQLFLPAFITALIIYSFLYFFVGWRRSLRKSP